MLLKGQVDLSIHKMVNKFQSIPSIRMELFKTILETHSIKMINSLEEQGLILHWTKNKKIILKRIIFKKTKNL
jgi:hypothetical protein